MSNTEKKSSKLQKELEALKVPAQWTGGNYGQELSGAIKRLQSRTGFSYDPQGDTLYQNARSTYLQGGRLAAEDTAGKTTARTGGYGNSYAQTAAQQTYQGYADKLTDKMPELYQLALDKYDKETADLEKEVSLLQDAYDQEYKAYNNQVSDYQTDRSRLDKLIKEALAEEASAEKASSKSSGGGSSSKKQTDPEGNSTSVLSNEALSSLRSAASTSKKALKSRLSALKAAYGLSDEAITGLYDTYYPYTPEYASSAVNKTKGATGYYK